jgi:hypothetical protein
MTSIPRPLLALLLAVAALFAVWTFALKPGSSGSPNTPAPAAPVKTPVHHATTAAAAATKSATTTPKPATTAAPAAPTTGPQAVSAALRAHKVIAILFYNPAASDDKAIKAELAKVPTHGGKVFKAAVPLSQILRYSDVSTQVTVQTSPTLVVLSATGQATAIAGFADRFEISRRIADALAAR